MHYGQKLQHCTLTQVWNELKLSCEFSKARNEVDRFNSQNRWRKRGIAMVPTKFGISFTLKLMNQVMVEKHNKFKFLYHNILPLCIKLYSIMLHVVIFSVTFSLAYLVSV